ncbi:pyruvate oxidase [Lactobacillus sp. LC28-10]|uniref:Pyruvate oxidase n=1 Tax=Secundilactobacillus angelensis TaxID=2722706 RepID=A0ABX1L0P4_9LACO|nr:thiamine pyrophosphate-dependent enzyme [Secundilactobacillus angelensis]MCH5462774.1 thiamine pyrophosphate-dependent enzyme [Secundilactobacillus angelensis]NLR19072.1 pyruvate oxidase [Secundilactobacillus angelensis]
MAQMKASEALVKELANWQIDHVYGIPADSLIDGFAAEQDLVRYIQVRHEEVGALAAAAESKLTGKIGVALAAVGPGAIHLIYGLCDAKMDHTPMLIIISNVATNMMNTHYLQDMDEDELFAGLDTFHRQVSDAKQIPETIRSAIQAAYETQSPSVVIIPDDLANVEIEYEAMPVNTHPKQILMGTDEQVAESIALIKQAKQPVMLVGTGIRHAQEEVVAFSKKFGLPVIPTAPAVGYVPTNFENNLGPQGTIGTQPAFEAMHMADLVVMVGTSYPFMRFMPSGLKTIQINQSAQALGEQFPATQMVQADAKTYLNQVLNAQPEDLPASNFLKACHVARKNWHGYLNERVSARPNGLLTPEAVLRQVSQLVTADTIYGLDIGNNTVWSARMLPFGDGQMMTMSSWFGAMGYALSAGIAAKLSYPDRRVITVSGDGGFSMVVQDILTQVQYQLPIINVVLENGGYGFIRQEKAKAGKSDYALKFMNANWAGVAENMGAIGLRVTNDDTLKEAVETIKQHLAAGDKRPILLDAIVTDEAPLDTSNMKLDPDKYSDRMIGQFRVKYHLDGDSYPSLRRILNRIEEEG